MPTTTAARKPTLTITQDGRTITATRLNPEHKRVDGRQYAIAIGGIVVQIITQVLDALEPQVLDQLIEDNVLPLRDEDLWAEVADEEARHVELLELASRRWDDVVDMLEADL